MDTFLTFSNVRSQVNLWWSQAGKANMKNAMQTGMGHNERNANDQNEEAEIRIGEHIFQACKKESFRYLGSMIHKSGRIEDDKDSRKMRDICTIAEEQREKGIYFSFRKKLFSDDRVDLWRSQAGKANMKNAMQTGWATMRGILMKNMRVDL
ncbi:hypothetical protein Tco_0243531 [Tanacetum coccineum]